MYRILGKQLGLLAATLFVAALLLVCKCHGQFFLGLAATRPFVAAGNAIASLFTKDVPSASVSVQPQPTDMQAALQAENAALRLENQQLRHALDLRNAPKWQPVTASILTRDPTLWDVRFTLDKGSASGIRVGALVVCGNVVCGRVCEVQRHSAVVETVASSQCHLAVTLSAAAAEKNATRAWNGVLNGRGGRRASWGDVCCRVDFLPVTAEITAQMPVYTSGLGGEVPSGFLVGHVATPDETGKLVEIIDDARLRTAVRPAIDLDAIRVVTVFTGRS